MKKYIAKPEFIGRKGNEELYELESALNRAITDVAMHRVAGFGEKEWEEAVPQTLRNILEGWDKNASKVAAKSFLSGETEEIEIK